MQWHLDEISSQVSTSAHAVLFADQAGWHTTAKLVIPPNITLLLLPPRSPELNPVENIWQFIRDNWLSNRIFKSYDDIVAVGVGFLEFDNFGIHDLKNGQVSAVVYIERANVFDAGIAKFFDRELVISVVVDRNERRDGVGCQFGFVDTAVTTCIRRLERGLNKLRI